MKSRFGRSFFTVRLGIVALLAVMLIGNLSTVGAAPIVVKVWHKASAQVTGPGKAAERFNASQKKIKVEIEYYGDNYDNTLKLGVAGGTVADIIEFTPSQPAVMFAEAGLVTDLQDIVAKMRKNIDPGVLTHGEYLYKGKLYSLPMLKTFYQLLYNKDLFKKAGLNPNKPPKTLEEMRAYAKKITAAGKGDFYGFGVALGAGTPFNRNIDQLAAAAGNYGPYGFDFNKGRFDFASEKKYFNWLVDLKKDGSIFPGEVSLGIEPLRAKFAEGKIGMYFDGSWMLGGYNVSYKTVNDWDYANLPVFAGEKFTRGLATYTTPFGIYARSKNIAAAKQFLMFLLKNGDVFPKYTSQAPTAFKQIHKITPSINVKQYKSVMAHQSKYTPLSVDPNSFLTLEGDNRDRVFLEEYVKATDGKSNIDRAITELNARYNKALDKAIQSGLLKRDSLKK